MLSAEGGKRWRWEDMTSGGIMLESTEMSEDDVLHAVAGGVNGDEQGEICPCSIWREGE